MALELSTTNADVINDLQAIADREPDNMFLLPISPMEGKEILTLVIENYATLSAGTVALIVALRNKIEYIRVTKDGLELKGAAKNEALNGKQ